MLGMLYRCVCATICSALEDANAALCLDSSWPKGYYRQGRAYAGLKVSNCTTATCTSCVEGVSVVGYVAAVIRESLESLCHPEFRLIVTGSEKTRHIVNSMKFELAVLLNSSIIELAFLQVRDRSRASLWS